MSAHDTTHHGTSDQERSKSSFSASFWIVIILVGLFIAALNFINVMGHDEEGGHGGPATHEAATTPAHEGEADAKHAEHADAQHKQEGAAAHDSTATEAAHH